MHYKIVKMGLGEFEVELPVESQFGFRVVGLVHHKNSFFVTHASMEEMTYLEKSLDDIGFTLSSASDTPEAMSTDSAFVINNTRNCTFVNGCPTAWIAWHDQYPETIFFVPEGFAKKPHFDIQPADLGIFDITDGKVVLESTCNNTTTLRQITENL